MLSLCNFPVPTGELRKLRAAFSAHYLGVFSSRILPFGLADVKKPFCKCGIICICVSPSAGRPF